MYFLSNRWHFSCCHFQKKIILKIAISSTSFAHCFDMCAYLHVNSKFFELISFFFFIFVNGMNTRILWTLVKIRLLKWAPASTINVSKNKVKRIKQSQRCDKLNQMSQIYGIDMAHLIELHKMLLTLFRSNSLWKLHEDFQL